MPVDRPRKVRVVMLGGTLAMSGSVAEGGAQPKMQLHELIGELPGALDAIELELVALSNEPSSFMTAAGMVALAGNLAEADRDPKLTGTIVLQGTDTLEETAFAVSLLTSLERPIVFTGSMKRYDELGYDGLTNIRDAIAVVTAREATSRGVMIVFGGSILEPAGTTKFRTVGTRVFDDPWNGPCGYIYQGNVRFLRQPSTRAAPFPGLVEDVGLLRSYAGMRAEEFRAFSAVCKSGLVLEAFGVGSIPRGILEGVEARLAEGLPIVVASQAPQGWTAPVYGFPGGGKYLQDLGCGFAGWLPGRKARLLLMGAVSAQSRPELKTLYAPYN